MKLTIRLDNMPDLNERIKAAFEENGWELASADGANRYYRDLASKFYSFLYPLTTAEQDLILSLLKTYHYCPTCNYEPLICRLAGELKNLWSKEYECMYVVSLTKPRDAGQIKGASYVLGHLREQVIREEFGIDDIPMRLYENQDLLKSKHSARGKSLIIFVDDFVGSGKTATETLTYYVENIKKDTDNLIVYSFVAMEEAITLITDMGINFNVFLGLPKGITDSGIFDNVECAIQTMLQLEKKMKIPASLKLGYGESEATTTLMRTPNNTFPVFWFPVDKDGNKSRAPFRRTR